jgi:hypothetical protein
MQHATCKFQDEIEGNVAQIHFVVGVARIKFMPSFFASFHAIKSYRYVVLTATCQTIRRIPESRQIHQRVKLAGHSK